MGIGMIVVVVLVAAAIYWIVRAASGHTGIAAGPSREYLAQGNMAPSRAAAADILDDRYARGEIGRDEYLERRRDLTGRG
jgi:uncharacterized membrane protein